MTRLLLTINSWNYQKWNNIYMCVYLQNLNESQCLNIINYYYYKLRVMWTTRLDFLDIYAKRIHNSIAQSYVNDFSRSLPLFRLWSWVLTTGLVPFISSTDATNNRQLPSVIKVLSSKRKTYIRIFFLWEICCHNC